MQTFSYQPCKIELREAVLCIATSQLMYLFPTCFSPHFFSFCFHTLLFLSKTSSKTQHSLICVVSDIIVHDSKVVLPGVRFHMFVDVLDEACGVVAEVAGERPLVEVRAQKMLNQIRTTSESFSALLTNLKH